MEAKKRSKAGGYAWRRHLREMLPLILPTLACSIILPVFLLAYFVPGKVDLATFLLVAVPLVALALISDKATDEINARWGEGARGEFRVGEELEKLYKDGFHVFHDWYSGRGNVDHFVVGPQGIFVVETKAWTGEITCEKGKLLRDGKRLAGKKDPIAQVKGEAVAIKELIEDTRAFKTWVNPILCFSRADVRCYEAVNDIEITNLGSLRHTIVNHPIGHSQFSPQRVNSISYFLEKYLGVAPAAKPGMSPAEPRKLKRVLDPARLFVAGYALFLLIISVVFADSTALLFERAASFYRFLGSAASYLS